MQTFRYIYATREIYEKFHPDIQHDTLLGTNFDNSFCISISSYRVTNTIAKYEPVIMDVTFVTQVIKLLPNLRALVCPGCI